ncbi:MAG: 2Fe-2S iron-sulfur cluster binding domain-containing protein [Gemmataceae bacterium]|nr:2Fe-2S iron-sulfur cluster binding domain-containing protein [Gemmataceae bacterium]
MAGVNPYIQPAKTEKAASKFLVTFLPSGKSLEVDPAKIPFNRTGLPGSILDIAYAAGVELDHACGGVCACSTCHVIIKKGLESCNTPTDDEMDMLDEARGVTTESRLGCQCVPNGTQEVLVEIPNWSRNLVREPH